MLEITYNYEVSIVGNSEMVWFSLVAGGKRTKFLKFCIIQAFGGLNSKKNTSKTKINMVVWKEERLQFSVRY